MNWLRVSVLATPSAAAPIQPWLWLSMRCSALVNAVGQQVDERATAGIAQGKLAVQPRAGKLERQPPLLGALHAGGEGKMAQFVPVQVTAIDRGTRPPAEHLVEPVTMVDQQLGQRPRRMWQLHNYQFR